MVLIVFKPYVVHGMYVYAVTVVCRVSCADGARRPNDPNWLHTIHTYLLLNLRPEANTDTDH